MRRTRSRSQKKPPKESEDDEPEPPPKVKKTAKIAESDSSSESDLEEYLKPAHEIDLNSSFFDLPKKNTNDETRISNNDEQPNNTNAVEECNNDVFDNNTQQPIFNFQHINNYMKQIEESKKLVMKYESKKGTESAEAKLDVASLLVLGERKSESFDPGSSVDETYESDEYESLSEVEDWEEVKERTIIPKEGVQITVELPNQIRKKKSVDLMAAVKRRLNKIKKEHQVLIHKVHLLCWIAHGNFINNVLNSPNLLALALSLIPSEHCYPPERTDLNYLEKFLQWYRKTIHHVEKKEKHTEVLEKELRDQISKKEAHNKKMLVLIFVCVLRSLGIQCRIVMSLQVEPLRPPQSELCSLSTKTDEVNKRNASEKTKTKMDSEEPKKNDIAKCKPGSSKSKKDKVSPNKNEVNCNVQRQKTEKQTVSSKNANAKHSTSKNAAKRSDETNKELNKRAKENSNSEIKEPNNCKTNSKTTRRKDNIDSKQKIEIGIKSISDEGQQHLLKTDTLKEAKGKATKHEKDNNRSKKPNLLNIKPSSESCNSKSTPLDSSSETVKSMNSKDKLSKKPNLSKIKVPSTSNASKSKQRKDESKIQSKHFKERARIEDSQKIPQLDGANDSDDNLPQTSKPRPKLNLKKLTETELNSCPVKTHLRRLKSVPVYKEVNSEDEFVERSPLTNKNTKPASSSKANLKNLKKRSASSCTDPRNKSSPSKQLDIRNDIIGLMKSRISEQKQIEKSKLVKGLKSVQTNDDDDSDYYPEAVKKKAHDSGDEFIEKPKVKRRIPTRKDIESKVSSSDSDADGKKKGVDVWAEVFLEAEEKWISVDVIRKQVHCVNEIYSRATHPISYIIAWNNNNSLKDITKRYCPNWNTVTRKLRVDQKWWDETLKPFEGKKTARDREEDEELALQQLEKPLPTTISEYKNHPLYALRRHLLKFEGIYPPDAPTLGFVRNEPVYSRDCVHTLHSRDIWLKHAKVVKPAEKPYKIVKARPKYDKLSNTVISDQPLEIFGPWQVEDYVPPVAENGIVPRNAYGNVELFKPCMLPKGTVHLQLPGLNKVAKKMNIDCAPALVGFDFHSGWSHPTYDGFVVCEEHSEPLIAGWYLEQEEAEKREQEKIEKRVYGNWKRLIKGLLIRERLKAKYDFGEPSSSAGGKAKRKNKGPTLVVKKRRRICSDNESDSD